MYVLRYIPWQSVKGRVWPQIQGIGSTAEVLQYNLDVCGPSVIHVTDTVLLPFQLNKVGATPTVTAAEGPPSG